MKQLQKPRENQSARDNPFLSDTPQEKAQVRIFEPSIFRRSRIFYEQLKFSRLLLSLSFRSSNNEKRSLLGWTHPLTLHVHMDRRGVADVHVNWRGTWPSSHCFPLWNRKRSASPNSSTSEFTTELMTCVFIKYNTEHNHKIIRQLKLLKWTIPTYLLTTYSQIGIKTKYLKSDRQNQKKFAWGMFKPILCTLKRLLHVFV